MGFRSIFSIAQPQAAVPLGVARLILRARRRLTLRSGALLGCAAVALAGCSMSSGTGALLVDPGRYELYHCNELAARWKVLVAREKELHGLIDRAEQANGGAVIASLAYRTDYDAVVGEERLIQRSAAEKKCSFPTQFQSDQAIR